MKKRALSLLMAFILIISLLPATARAAETEMQGSGKEADPYLIKDKADLAKVSNDLTAHYKLTENIGTETDPVTTAIDGSFSGTFDGNGHTITLKITEGSNIGLFSKIAAGGTVKNVITTGSVTGNNCVGGIAGVCEGTIEKCGNMAEVTGTKNVGGITGQAGYYKANSTDSKKANLTNCYNAGTISLITGKRNMYSGGILGSSQNSSLNTCVNTGSVSGKMSGGIYGFAATSDSRTAFSNCYYLAGTNTAYQMTDCTPYTDANNNNIIDKLGPANWQLDTNGNPVLMFGSTKPSVSVTASSASLQMVNSGSQPTSTLTVKTENINMDGAAVEWSTEQTDIISLNDGGDDLHEIAQALQPGTAAVTVTVTPKNGTPVTDSADITVLPCFTTVEIRNEKGDMTLIAGQKAQAVVSVNQGGSYDPAEDERLTYRWYWYPAGGFENKQEIKGETGRVCEIPSEFSGQTGTLYLYVEVYLNESPAKKSSGESLTGYGSFYYDLDALVNEDKAALTLEKLGVSSTTITAETTLTLPNEGENGSTITWESSDPSVIDPTTGKVTLPIEGEQEVTLTAKLTLNGKTAELPITFVVKSKTAQAVDADKETLENAAKSLSTLYPRFGKDSNVQTMVETRLAKEFPNVGVTYTGKTPQNATANGVHSDISDNGNITYFYTDLTTTDLTTTLQRFDTYKASFMLTCGKETKAVKIPVIVYWDADKVRDFMTKEVLNQTTLPEQTTEALMLPTSGKWTTISWTSSDPTIIANDGTITRSTIDQQAVLTATFTFNFTSDVTGNEQLIVLYKTFEVTVKGNADAADRAALYQQKLDDALAAPGLKDFVTGEKLTEENGVYAVRNDIQFPTTRDLKIDGKYTPVVITSSDSGVIEAPTTPNSARVWVYRPLPGEAAKTVTLTVKILDRPNGEGRDYASMPVLAEKTFTIAVEPLTRKEVGAELALMAEVKAHYWDGIKNGNTAAGDVTGDLAPFVEVYKQDGALVWVRDVREMKNSGIVPAAMDGWQELEAWRLFRSSNADVVAHENLLVTRQGDSKAVTITSYLSSETLGRYAEKYP